MPSSAGAAGPSGLRRRIVPVLTISIEAAMGAGSDGQEEFDMATIGTFKKTGAEYVGEIVLLDTRRRQRSAGM